MTSDSQEDYSEYGSLAHEHFFSHSTPKIVLDAELIIGTEALVSALKQERAPDNLEEEFVFSADTYPALSTVARPNLVKDQLLTRELAAIAITVTQQPDSYRTLSLEFHDDDGNTVHISRSNHLEDTSGADMLLKPKPEEPVEIPRISQSEINTTIMSLIAPSQLGNYSYADNIDFLDSKDTVSALVSYLAGIAPEYGESGMFNLNEGKGTLKYFYRNGEAVSLRLSRNVGREGRSIVAEIDCDPETTLRLVLHPEDKTTEPVDVDETIKLLEYIQTSLEDMANIPETRLDDTNTAIEEQLPSIDEEDPDGSD